MAVLLPVKALRAHCDPFRHLVWEGLAEPVQRSHVRLAIAHHVELATPVEGADRSGNLHARRIAWFVRHGWTDAIDLDVGVPSMGCFPRWFIQDGNHRLAAAIFRGDPHIRATVGGDVDYAHELFGVSVIEREHARTALAC